MMSNNITEMGVDALLYSFHKRMQLLLKQDAGKHQMDAEPPWVVDIIENEIMPAVEKILDWEPTDDQIIASNTCGTPWHDGCK